MDKTAIKKFATEARRELIARVSQRAQKYGISSEDIGNPNADSVNGQLLSSTEKSQRKALIEQIKAKGYEQVMEEVAYTWFNRFSALRFMEVNGYLPTRIRVFTDENNDFKPEILTEAIHLELDGLDMERVYAYKENNDNDELYKYLLITQCNALYKLLPKMFQRITDYTELLFPDNILRDGSVIHQMIALIPEEDWQDQVQIIGWLYQYYNSEKKDDVFAALKKNVKITKENIPAATQLFTPDWIVRYMVENSLGRLWVEGHPNDELKDFWKYYLEEAEQEPEVQEKLAEIRKGYVDLNPEDIKCIDPCAGSGHILVYMFDLLVQIYEAHGVQTREAVRSIIENNIYGLDIDDRAAQLAYFSVMMKACQYDRRFLRHGVQPHVYAIVESNNVDDAMLEYFCNGNEKLRQAMDTIRKEMQDAKEYGSIITVSQQDWMALYERFGEIETDINMFREAVLEDLLPLVQVAETLAQQYHVVVTNPPYMGASNMNTKLNKFIKNNYADYKSDFFSAFVVHASEMTALNGYCGFFTPYVWMFIQSYEKLRQYLYNNTNIETLIQFEYSAFEEATVPVCTFTFSNSHVKGKKGNYLRLVDFRGGMEVQRRKTLEAIVDHNCGYYYEQTTDNFSKIPGSPVAYWVSENFTGLFSKNTIRDVAFAGIGMRTGDNNRFLRFWHEISRDRLFCSCCDAKEALAVHAKWIPYNKGGESRRWYGNNEFVVNWENDGEEIKDSTVEKYPQLKDNLGWKISNEGFYFRPILTWSFITSAKFMGVRAKFKGCISDVAGSMVVPIKVSLEYLAGLLCSKVSEGIINVLNPTLNVQVKDIANIPVVLGSKEQGNVVEATVQESIRLSRTDWDSYETSWDFKRHPMLAKGKLSDAYDAWKADCESRFLQLQSNEEELNRIFIDIYGLQEELTPDVADKDVTVHRIFDTKEDVPESMKGSNYVRTLRDEIVSLLSYAVGCMFGRYSLDVEGIAYAGGEWCSSKYETFQADQDNIIPICDDEYFEDDIVGRLVEFLKVVYGADTLEENLRFVADALGGKGTSREVIRNYFINDFYKDHCRTYQKRPIYWLFDSGKKNGFKCLIYMHRYQPDTIARIRTDYVHEQQTRYRTAIADLTSRMEGCSTSERVKLSKILKKLNDQSVEIHDYEEKIHHLADRMIPIDLDDGVKKNYAIFQDVLAKIK